MVVDKVGALHIGDVSHNPGNGPLKVVEIRLGVGQVILSLFEFGGRDHIHGVSDLHGVLNTLHPAFDFSGVGHITTCP